MIDFHSTLMWSLGSFATVVGLAGLASVFWPRDELQEFQDHCRKQGLDFKETQAALAIRVSFVRVRRKASALCIEKAGAITDEDIGELVAMESAILHQLHDFDTAKRFVAWINACPKSEILYAEAMEVRMAYLRAKNAENPVVVDPRAIEDLYAAVRTVKR